MSGGRLSSGRRLQETDVFAVLLRQVVAGVHSDLGGSGNAAHGRSLDRSRAGDGVPRQRPGIGMELSDDTFWVNVDHMHVDLPAVGVGIDKCRVEVPAVDLDRLALAPFELPLEAVLLNDVGVARKICEQDKQIQVFVFAGHTPEESVHAPSHPSPSTGHHSGQEVRRRLVLAQRTSPQSWVESA
jgi:hypothetical protein